MPPVTGSEWSSNRLLWIPGGVHGASRGLWNSIASAATRRLRPTELAVRIGTIKQGLASVVMRSVAKQLSALSAVTRPEKDDGSLGYSGTEDED